MVQVVVLLPVKPDCVIPETAVDTVNCPFPGLEVLKVSPVAPSNTCMVVVPALKSLIVPALFA